MRTEFPQYLHTWTLLSSTVFRHHHPMFLCYMPSMRGAKWPSPKLLAKVHLCQSHREGQCQHLAQHSPQTSRFVRAHSYVEWRGNRRQQEHMVYYTSYYVLGDYASLAPLLPRNLGPDNWSQQKSSCIGQMASKACDQPQTIDTLEKQVMKFARRSEQQMHPTLSSAVSHTACAMNYTRLEHVLLQACQCSPI